MVLGIDILAVPDNACTHSSMDQQLAGETRRSLSPRRTERHPDTQGREVDGHRRGTFLATVPLDKVQPLGYDFVV